jgi:hypothetical protein
VSAAVPAALAESTVKAAGLFAAGPAAAGVISANVAGLTEGVVRAMFLGKLKTPLATVLVVSGLLALAYGLWAGGRSSGKAEGAEDPAATAGEEPRGGNGPGKDPPPVVRGVDPDARERIEEAEKAVPKDEAATGGVRDPELKLGRKFEGEIHAQMQRGEGHLFGYLVEHPLSLKAGSNVSASVTVVGQHRSVGLMLKDPTGKILGSSQMLSRTARIRVEEVNANGTYTIEVYSDLIGPFTLWATDTTDELDKKMLEEKIDRLEKELAELRQKLKAKDEKPR